MKRTVSSRNPLRGIGVAVWIVLSCAISVLCAMYYAGPKEYSTTLMVYLCGSNLETEAGAASHDLEEMQNALRNSDNLEIFVLAGGSNSWNMPGIDPDSTNIYRLKEDSVETVRNNPYESMGDPNTLLQLLNYGVENSCTDRYALLLWDHGAGPMFGLCFDEKESSDGSLDYLSLEELSDALERSPFSQRKLDWIGMDACLMASAETAWTVAPYAEYLIASQETEPSSGWDYSFLEDISHDASATDTGRRAVERYIASDSETMTNMTLSCIDLSKMELLAEEMSEAFSSIKIDKTNYEKTASIRVDAKAMGRGTPYEYDLVDLGSLLSGFKESGLVSADQALSGLQEAVVAFASNHEGFSGLSIYYPFYNKPRYTSPWSRQYQTMQGSKGYQEFIHSTGTMWLSEELADWNSCSSGAAEQDSSGMIFFQLTDEQKENLAKARLVVVDENYPGSFYQTFVSDDVACSSGGILSVQYHNEALYFTDKDHVPLTNAVSYTMMGDCIAVPAMVYNLQKSIDEGKPVVPSGHDPTYLLYKQDDRGQWNIIDFLEYNPDKMLYGKSTLKLDDWDMVVCSAQGRCMPTEENAGGLLFRDWEKNDLWYGREEKVSELGMPEFLTQLDDSERYVFFEITDLQGNQYATRPTRLNNPYRQNLPVQVPILFEDKDVQITLKSLTMVSASQPGLRMQLEIVNRAGRDLWLTFRDMKADDISLPAHSLGDPDFWASAFVPAEETKSFELSVDGAAFHEVGLELIHALGFKVFCCEDSFREEETFITEGQAEIILDLDVSGLYLTN